VLKRKIISMVLCISLMITSLCGSLFISTKGLVTDDDENKTTAVIKNGSFEEGKTHWEHNVPAGNNYHKVVTTKASDGEKSVQLYLYNKLYQLVEVEPNTDYTLYFDCYGPTDGNSSYSMVSVNAVNSDDTLGSEIKKLNNVCKTKDRWLTREISFNSGSNSKIIIGITEGGSTNNTFVDNFVLKESPLVKNGSFEEGKTHWEHNVPAGNNYHNIVTTKASDGEKSVQLYLYNKLYQLVEVEPNTNYTLYFDCYGPTDGNSSYSIVSVHNVNSDDTLGSEIKRLNNVCKTKDKWLTREITFNSGSNTKIIIGITEGGSTNNTFIDNFVLKESPLVKNGSFEEGKAYWEYNVADTSGITANQDIVSHGEKSMKLKMYYWLYQLVEIEANTNYTLYFDAYGPSGNTSWTNVFIYNVKEDGTKGDEITRISNVCKTNGEWLEREVSFNSGSNTKIIIGITDGTDYNNTYVDNFKLKESSLIRNGSFESGGLEWTLNDNTIVSDKASDGLNSLSLKNYCHLYQNTEVKNNTFYKVVVDVYNVDAGWAKADIRNSDGSSSIFECQLHDFGRTDWETVEFTFNSGDNTEIRLDFVQGEADGIRIDNVRMFELTTEIVKEKIDGNIIYIESDKEYSYTIAWETADGSDFGEFDISGKARKYGDVNGDGTSNVKDLVAIKKGLVNLSNSLVYDVTLDNDINSFDVTEIRKLLLGISPAKKIIQASNYGITPSSEVSSKLTNLLEENNSDSIVVIQPGEYNVDSQILVNGLENVTIKADGAKFITKFEKNKPYAYYAGFQFENCSNLELQGATFATSEYANTTARVVEIVKNTHLFDDDDYTFTFELEDGFTLANDENIGFYGIDTYTEEGTPNGHILRASYDGWEWQWIDSTHVKVTLVPEETEAFDLVKNGELVILKHSLVDTPPLVFQGCQDVLVEDVTVESSAGRACYVTSDNATVRSADFTFRRYNVGLPEGSKQLCSSQVDALHIKGLEGSLVLEDCHFTNIGDDGLNVHQSVGEVSSVNGNNVVVTGEIAPIIGDVIYVYDSQSGQKTAEFTVENFANDTITMSNIIGNVKKGNKLGIEALYPTVNISNSSVKNSRARGYLIQTGNVTVDNCSFEGIVSTALMLNYDTADWYELGPVHNAVIKNNTFNNCGASFSNERAGGIVIADDHKTYLYEYESKETVHSNISILQNKFENMGDSAIFADAVDGIIIKDNIINDCCTDTDGRASDYCSDIVLFNCKNVVTDNNGDATINNK